MESSATALVLFLMLALAASNRAVASEEEQDNGPPALVIVNLEGRGDDTTALAVHKHDLSLAGFTNGSGHWHAFPEHGHLIPTSTPLPFSNSYDDLGNLPGVPLGRASMLHATRALHAYDPAAADADELEALKRALAALTVMVCEVQRVKPIRDAVAEGWDGEARVSREHLPYIEHWDTISYEITHANRTGNWDGFFAGMLEIWANIHSKEEALAVVNIAANRTFGEVFKNHEAALSKRMSDFTGVGCSCFLPSLVDSPSRTISC